MKSSNGIADAVQHVCKDGALQVLKEHRCTSCGIQLKDTQSFFGATWASYNDVSAKEMDCDFVLQFKPAMSYFKNVKYGADWKTELYRLSHNGFKVEMDKKNRDVVTEFEDSDYQGWWMVSYLDSRSAEWYADPDYLVYKQKIYVYASGASANISNISVSDLKDAVTAYYGTSSYEDAHKYDNPFKKFNMFDGETSYKKFLKQLAEDITDYAVPTKYYYEDGVRKSEIASKYNWSKIKY